MTQRFFYTDALAAAWMMKHFKMRIHTGGGDTCDFRADFSGNYYEEDLLSLGGKLYIHPGSLHLLEPKVGDLCATRCGKYVGYVLCEGVTEERQINDMARNVNLMDGVYIDRSDVLSIIQRVGIAFHHPQSEDV